MVCTDINATFQVPHIHRLRFADDMLAPADPTLAECLTPDGDRPARVLAFVDTHVAEAFSDLPERLRAYAAKHGHVHLAGPVQPVVGGELCKNDRDAMYRVLSAIHDAGLDRRSYVLAIGGGAVLDCVGFAAAIAHRGVRLVRIPTTTLAQADSGVGVKNGINGFGKKNYLGSFAVPWAVINDASYLRALPRREWRGGFSEAVKVALLKDAGLFDRIEHDAERIALRNLDSGLPVIERSARLHLEHITQGGDPFEEKTARPLDFGHWSAHRLESMTDYQLRHGEAVAIGLALDATYAERVGLMRSEDAQRVRACLRGLGFELWHEVMRDADALLAGLEEFREHLGGELTITLVCGVGEPVDVHEMNEPALRAAIGTLATDQARLSR